MRLMTITCLFMVVPFIVFYTRDEMNSTWINIYWLWEKSKDLLVASTLFFLSYKQYKAIPLLCIIFTFTRLVWHTLAVTLPAYKVIDPIEALNKGGAIAILFLILATLLTVSMIVLFVAKWRTDPKWLDGY